jgi:hypothetical protein
MKGVTEIPFRDRGFVIELKLTVIHILTSQPPRLFVICVSQLSASINIHCDYYGEFKRRSFNYGPIIRSYYLDWLTFAFSRKYVFRLEVERHAEFIIIIWLFIQLIYLLNNY